MRSSGLSGGYWLFLGASSFFVLGMFIYVLLYNLYLMDLGFREDFVGQVNSASTAGMVAAILPAAALARRWGLGRMLLVSFASVGAISVVRVLVTTGRRCCAGAGERRCVLSVRSFAGARHRAADQRQSALRGLQRVDLQFHRAGNLRNWLGGHLPGWLGGKRPAMLADARCWLWRCGPRRGCASGPRPPKALNSIRGIVSWCGS